MDSLNKPHVLRQGQELIQLMKLLPNSYAWDLFSLPLFPVRKYAKWNQLASLTSTLSKVEDFCVIADRQQDKAIDEIKFILGNTSNKIATQVISEPRLPDALTS